MKIDTTSLEFENDYIYYQIEASINRSTRIILQDLTVLVQNINDYETINSILKSYALKYNCTFLIRYSNVENIIYQIYVVTNKGLLEEVLTDSLASTIDLFEEYYYEEGLEMDELPEWLLLDDVKEKIINLMKKNNISFGEFIEDHMFNFFADILENEIHEIAKNLSTYHEV